MALLFTALIPIKIVRQVFGHLLPNMELENALLLSTEEGGGVIAKTDDN